MKKNQLTVREPLMDHRWVQDISGGNGIALYDFLDVWDLDTIVQLHPNAEDDHRWRFTE